MLGLPHSVGNISTDSPYGHRRTKRLSFEADPVATSYNSMATGSMARRIDPLRLCALDLVVTSSSLGFDSGEAVICNDHSSPPRTRVGPSLSIRETSSSKSLLGTHISLRGHRGSPVARFYSIFYDGNGNSKLQRGDSTQSRWSRVN